MGSFTPNFKFYKPAADEVVDVNQQLNANLDLAEKFAAKYFDYEYFTGEDMTETYGYTALGGEKYYKTASNSVFWAVGPGDYTQDFQGFVSDWVDFSADLNLGFEPYDSGGLVAPPMYRLISSDGGATTAEVELTGRVWQNGTTLAQGVTTQFATNFSWPPVVTKYFDVFGGNTSSSYSIHRVAILTNGNMEFFRMGTGTPSASESYVDLGGIKFNVEVPAA